MPTVDSSDKSNLPVSTISDSASTTSASAADAPRTLIRFALREKARADERADREQQRERGQQREIAKPREFDARTLAAHADACAPGAAPAERRTRERYSSWRLTPSTDAISSWSCQPAGNSAAIAPRNMTRTRSQVRRSSSSPDTTSTALPSSRTRSTTDEQRFLGFHVDAGGRVDQHQHVGIGCECARHHDFLLVAARQAGYRVLRPLRLDAERVDHAAAERVLLRRRRDAEAPERARDRHRCVFGHRLRQHQSLAMPVLRHAADAMRQARRARRRAGARGRRRGSRPRAGALQSRDRLRDARAAARRRARQTDDFAAAAR